MITYVYLIQGEKIFGTSISSPEYFIPRGIKYYTYTDASEIDEKISNDNYTGVSSGENYHED